MATRSGRCDAGPNVATAQDADGAATADPALATSVSDTNKTAATARLNGFVPLPVDLGAELPNMTT